MTAALVRPRDIPVTPVAGLREKPASTSAAYGPAMRRTRTTAAAWLQRRATPVLGNELECSVSWCAATHIGKERRRLVIIGQYDTEHLIAHHRHSGRDTPFAATVWPQ